MKDYVPNFTIIPLGGSDLPLSLDKLFSEIFGQAVPPQRDVPPPAAAREVIEVHPRTVDQMMALDLLDFTDEGAHFEGRKIRATNREAPFISDRAGYREAYIGPAACDCPPGSCLGETKVGVAGSAEPEHVAFTEVPYDIELDEAVEADRRETAASLARTAETFASALVLISTFAGEAYAS